MRSSCAAVALSGLLCLSAAPDAWAEEGLWMADAISGCQVWSTDKPQPAEAVSWAGACMDGKASGWGVLIFWDQQGLGGRYIGEMLAGKLHGNGLLSMRDEERGGFLEYNGHFADSKPVGKGFLKLADGTQFYGELLDGARHGRGIVLTADGWLAKGEFKDGKGVGTLVVDYTAADGERYIGQAANNKRQGFGILTTPEGDFYAGRFADGLPDGPGLYKGAAGDRFEGEFKGGKPNGFGTSTDAAGNVLQGHFVDGEPVGTVLVTLPDGTQSAVDAKIGGAQ
jgi:hypothetical protein